MYFLYYRV